MSAQLARALAGVFLVLQVVLLLECVYATSEWLTDHTGPWRMAALVAVRTHLHLCRVSVKPGWVRVSDLLSTHD